MHYRLSIIFTLLVWGSILTKAQEEWIVPDDKKDKLSPFAFNDSITEAGRLIYEGIDLGNCLSCHGNPGKDNWQKLIPPPNDPAGEKIQNNNDGELYHKIYEGRVAMPSFKDKLSSDQIWSVISYLRSFNDTYVQEVAKEIIQKGYKGDVIILLTQLDKHTLQSQVVGINNNKKETLENVEIKLALKRAFGHLTIDEVKFTNRQGIATFIIPNDIPGDSSGNVNLIARLTNKELFGEVKTDTVLALGIATNKPSLVAKRAMWNQLRMAPLWILVAYSGGVILAWGIIFYILLQLKKIFEIGRKEETI